MAPIGSGDVVLLYGLDSSGVPVPLKLNSDGSLSGSGGGGGSGTVTSVGVAVPSILTVSGSPVTTSGTITIGLATQTANTILAGPSSGGAATPTFRALVEADLGTGTGTTGKFLRGDMTWSNTIVGPVTIGTHGATLETDAANALGQRNSTTTQVFRVYNTYTNASNYERIAIQFASGNAAIDAEKSSGNAALFLRAQGASSLYLGHVAGAKWEVNSSGHFLTIADNTYDIGASGATRPRTLYVGTSIVIGTTATLGALAAASLRLGAAPSASPVAQTLTIGEASRPGTDTNVAGANGTIQSGLGTGTGTESSLTFQTPLVAASGSSVQTYVSILKLTRTAVGAAGPVQIAQTGNQVAGSCPTIMGSNAIGLAIESGGVTPLYLGTTSSAASIGIYAGGSALTYLRALANASLQFGSTPSATPVAQTLTIGEASRPGTDTNVAGASGTLQSGLGTGTGTPSPLILKAPVTVASGSGVQTQTEGLRVQGVGAAIGLGFYGHAAAVRPAAYTPTNVVADRSYDANATTIDEIADVVGTLIADLQSIGLLQ